MKSPAAHPISRRQFAQASAAQWQLRFRRRALEAGCVGLSSDLIYDPGRHARAQEPIELASLMRGTGALYATHMRDEGLGLLDSVSEAIEIGERAWGLVKKIARPHRSRPSERRKRPHRPAPLHGGQFA